MKTFVNLLIRIKFPQVQPISTAALASWLEQDGVEKPLLLDTRTKPEYAVSHLWGAQLVAPDTKDFANLAPLDLPIVTYCSVGYRSAAIAHRLQEAGYTKVVNLEGSIFQWANEGRPLYRNDVAVQQVHPYNSRWGRLLHSELHAYEPQAGS
jgi:rhodanese-related sulfurtransferase